VQISWHFISDKLQKTGTEMLLKLLLYFLQDRWITKLVHLCPPPPITNDKSLAYIFCYHKPVQQNTRSNWSTVKLKQLIIFLIWYFSSNLAPTSTPYAVTQFACMDEPSIVNRVSQKVMNNTHAPYFSQPFTDKRLSKESKMKQDYLFFVFLI
jgi:hypothetical protein